jgi:hypothetical protein
MWMAKYLPALDNINFPYGTKIYVKYLYPFGNMEIEGWNMEENLSSGFLGFGISKDFYFAHYFSVTPYFGYQSMLSSEKNKDDIENMNISTSGIEIGLNGSMAILHNAQVVGNLGWNTLKARWFSTGLTVGVGLRYQF